MQPAITKGFDLDTISIEMKDETIGKFRLQILFWVDKNEYWVYLTDDERDTDMPIICHNPREALNTYNCMKRFIKREILKESE